MLMIHGIQLMNWPRLWLFPSHKLCIRTKLQKWLRCVCWCVLFFSVWKKLAFSWQKKRVSSLVLGFDLYKSFCLYPLQTFFLLLLFTFASVWGWCQHTISAVQISNDIFCSWQMTSSTNWHWEDEGDSTLRELFKAMSVNFARSNNERRKREGVTKK